MKGLLKRTVLMWMIVSFNFLGNPVMSESGVLPIEIQVQVDKLTKVLTDFVYRLIERFDTLHEQDKKESVPTLIIKLSQLAAQKDTLANDLDIYADMLRLYSSDVVLQIEQEGKQGSRIDKDLSEVSEVIEDIKALSQKLDREWVKTHSIETTEVFKVIAGKEAVVLKIENRVEELTYNEVKEFALVFKEEAKKLRGLAKTLGDTFHAKTNPN
jgi:hypothetical protein